MDESIDHCLHPLLIQLSIKGRIDHLAKFQIPACPEPYRSNLTPFPYMKQFLRLPRPDAGLAMTVLVISHRLPQVRRSADG